MKANTETSRQERLRLVIGGVLSLSGLGVALFVGVMYGYSSGAVWAIGLGLLIMGVWLAGSMRLIAFLQDVTRF